MKYLKTLVIIALLFGLPAGSWFFLQHGLDWRREKRTQLVPKQDLMKDVNWTSEQLYTLEQDLAGYTTLVICKDQNEEDKAVIDQFKDAYTFQVKEAGQLPASIADKLNTSQASYLLIDTGMILRQIYPDGNSATIKRLVEDLALTIPQQPVKEIKLRDRTNDE